MQNVKVVLTGDGGDEVFGGYPWRHILLDKRTDAIESLIRSPLKGILRSSFGKVEQDARWENGRLYDATVRRMRMINRLLEEGRESIYFQTLYCFTQADKHALYAPEWSRCVGDVDTDDYLRGFLPDEGMDRLDRWLLFDLRTTLVNEMLAKVDRATMATGLEARVPLLDHTVIETAFSISSSLKVRGDEGKIILKDLAGGFAEPGFFERPKHGFNIPFRVWFRDELKEYMQRIFENNILEREGYFKAGAVQGLFQAHLNDTRRDFSNQLYTIAGLIEWMNTYL